MPIDLFERELLNDAWQQMSEECVQCRLSAFVELRKTALNNEGWFEWELYYHLLRVNRGWNKEKRAKGNRKVNDRHHGDGVDLQFSNGKFIEVRAVTTEKGTMNWVLKGLSDHPDADACIFLALYSENLKKWLAKNAVDENRIRCKGQLYELLLKQVNESWVVGVVKKVS